MFNSLKDKAKLVLLNKGLKSIEIFKNEKEKVAAYEAIFKLIVPMLKTNVDKLSELSDKKKKRIKSQVSMVKKIYISAEKNQDILKRNNDVFALYEEFKLLSKKYFSLF